MRTIRRVDAGEELCHSYIDLCSPTSLRRNALVETYGFDCDCDHCSSPTVVRHRAEAGAEKDLDCCLVGPASGTEQMSSSDREGILTRAAALEAECAMMDDIKCERQKLTEAKELLAQVLDPLHSELYRLHGLCLNAAIVEADYEAALVECSAVVHFLETTLEHVPNHPLLALQLYTLSDLEATIPSRRASAKEHLMKAKKMLLVTHGPDAKMTRGAQAGIEALSGL